MKILAIESSCDETAAAVVENGRTVLSSVVASQVEEHKIYGGVVPEIASRKHIVHIMPVIEETLQKAKLELKDIDQIAVTYGPGLVGALLVGVSAAKALAFTLDVPLIGVNHLEGHIFANFLSHPDLKPPFMALVVSGGHTSLVHVKDYNSFKLMGQTRDDAAGEAFDKVARVMGLPYPGGPQIDKLAKEGNPLAIDFPQAMKNEENFEFSFSGLKSAVLNYLNSMQQKHIEINKADVAASFQHSVIEVLIAKAMQAVQESHCDTLVLAGGVAANSSLESRLREAADKAGIRFCFPNKLLCTDNAAMIGCRGYYKALAGFKSDYYLNAVPGLGLEDL